MTRDTEGSRFPPLSRFLTSAAQTNAYAVLPESQWRDYRPPQEPPAPARAPGAIHRPCIAAVAQAALEGDLVDKAHGALASDPKDGLAAALARLGRAFMARDL